MKPHNRLHQGHDTLCVERSARSTNRCHLAYGRRIALALAGLLLCSMGAGQGRPGSRPVSPGGKRMDRDQFITRLRQIDPDNELQITALARDAKKDARETAQAAVTLWKGKDLPMAHKALLFLSELEEFAIQPLVEAPTPPKPQDRVWMMQTAVAHEIALRERVTTRGRRLLEDRTSLPIDVPPQRAESRSPPRRVCDEAYMELRRLLNTAESPEQFYSNMRVFLTLTDAEKDAAIARARQSPSVWTRFVKEE